MEVSKTTKHILDVVNNSPYGWLDYDSNEAKEIEYIITQQEEQWISVEDRLPTEYGKYWVYRAGDGKQHREVWNNTGWSVNNNIITHWQPLPTPPKNK